MISTWISAVFWRSNSSRAIVPWINIFHLHCTWKYVPAVNTQQTVMNWTHSSTDSAVVKTYAYMLPWLRKSEQWGTCAVLDYSMIQPYHKDYVRASSQQIIILTVFHKILLKLWLWQFCRKRKKKCPRVPIPGIFYVSIETLPYYHDCLCFTCQHWLTECKR